tara:strand:+ start:396 stop:1142 length:747 start_codon:yes stop_codon:yes gene_type:complete
MDEEELIRLADELKKEQTIKVFKDTNMPVTFTANPDEGYVRGEIGDQNITLNKDASAIIEKEIELDEDLKAYLTRELRKGGDEATGIQLKNSNFNIQGSTDHNKEQRANFSGQTNTPLGNIGGRLNTDFARNENGEIFWRSPDGKWNASGYTNFDDFTQANIGYNKDKFNIDLDMDSMGNENLRAQWNPNENLSIGGGFDFGGSRNISAKGTVPISKNWVVDALLGRRENKYEDENEFLFNLRRRFNN